MFVAEVVADIAVDLMSDMTAKRTDTNWWLRQPLSQSEAFAERKIHPQTTPPEIVTAVIEASLSNPLWGCCKLAVQLKKRSILISSPTIQKILIKQQLASSRDRALRLIEMAQNGQILSPFQTLQIERILGVNM